MSENETYEGKLMVVGVSGGKDSTATCLHLMEQGYAPSDFLRVFADTGWETKGTYEYLTYLEEKLGPIQRIKKQVEINEEFRSSIELIESKLGFESPFVRLCYDKKRFPSSAYKFCTIETKINPFTEFYKNMDDQEPVNIVGIRREESKRRSTFPEWEYHSGYDCWTHRPLIDWTEQQVIDIHHRFGIVPNKLYLNGHSRVGCYPCIFSRKKEVKILSEERQEIIELMEKDLGKTLFSPKSGFEPGIRGTVDWGHTLRGGKYWDLLDVVTPTCEKWGLCDFGG